MENSGEILRQFYAAVQKKDIVAARKYLSDDLVFVGLFETYPSPRQDRGDDLHQSREPGCRTDVRKAELQRKTAPPAAGPSRD